MLAEVDTIETRLFYFMGRQIGIQNAFAVLKTLTRVFKFLEPPPDGHKIFTALERINDEILAEAISLATNCPVHAISRISLSSPATTDLKIDAILEEGHLFEEVITERFCKILQKNELAIVCQQFLTNGTGDAELRLRNAFESYVTQYIWHSPRFKLCLSNNVLMLIGHYLCLTYAGEENYAKSLALLTSMTPDIIPFCCERSHPEHWFVVVP